MRHSWFDARAKVQHNDFHLFRPDGNGSFSLKREEHAQRVWPLKEFDRAAAAAGLVRLAAYDDDYSQATPRSERVHLLFVKPKVRKR